MRFPLVAGALVATFLAGCAAGGGEGAPPGPAFEDLGLQATEATGIIRGVVVDEAIRPLANVTVQVRTDPPREARTNADGLFGFDHLEPGTYFMEIGKLGYFGAQQSADVVAGVPEPPIVKVILRADLANTPFVQALVFDGYIECTTSVLVLCGAPAVLTGENLTNDRFAWDQFFADDADLLQAEMVWESNQALSPELFFEMESINGDCEDKDEDNEVGSYFNNTSGVSPIYATVNQTQIEEFEVGTKCGIWVSIFSGAITGTPCFDDVDPTGTLPAWCVGFTLEQRFTMYFHTFHGYTPHSGWRFTVAPPPPPPA